MAEKIYLRGKINWNGYLNGDADDCTAIQTEDENIVFSQFFEENLLGKTVSINYYITDEMSLREDLEKQYIDKIYGIVEAECECMYTEITGYIGCRENCFVGGHDLLHELDNYEGKYIDMEISIDERSEK